MPPPGAKDDPRPATIEFNRDIRPILSDKCFTCHGPDKANRVTELRFDTEAGAKIALSEGRQSLVPGDPDKSELFRRIVSNDEAVRFVIRTSSFLSHSCFDIRHFSFVIRHFKKVHHGF